MDEGDTSTAERHPPPKPAGETQVDVRLSYDLNEILEVEMNVVGTSRKEVLVIERNPGQLTRAQVEAARKALAVIKFHPRESLPNRTALARARPAASGLLLKMDENAAVLEAGRVPPPQSHRLLISGWPMS